MRPDRDTVLIEMARLIATRSTCDRRHVGAVIARESRVLSMGYAGAPPGFPHCSFALCGDRKDPCTRTIHAEANAIAWAARGGIAIDGCAIYTTASPCNDCAKLILSAGLKQVYYLEEYRDPAPLLLLKQGGIYAEKLQLQKMLSLAYND